MNSKVIPIMSLSYLSIMKCQFKVCQNPVQDAALEIHTLSTYFLISVPSHPQTLSFQVKAKVLNNHLHLMIWLPVTSLTSLPKAHVILLTSVILPPWSRSCRGAFVPDLPSAWNMFSQLSPWPVQLLHFLQISICWILH